MRLAGTRETRIADAAVTPLARPTDSTSGYAKSVGSIACRSVSHGTAGGRRDRSRSCVVGELRRDHFSGLSDAVGSTSSRQQHVERLGRSGSALLMALLVLLVVSVWSLLFRARRQRHKDTTTNM